MCALLLASSPAAPPGAGAAAAPCVGAAPPAECAHFLARRCEARVHLHNELFLLDPRQLPDGVLVEGLGADELSALYARPLLRPGAAEDGAAGGGGGDGGGGRAARRAPMRDPRFHAAKELQEMTKQPRERDGFYNLVRPHRMLMIYFAIGCPIWRRRRAAARRGR
ncbi:Protein of unknown function, partial [Gryllus bimaculatus]